MKRVILIFAVLSFIGFGNHDSQASLPPYNNVVDAIATIGAYNLSSKNKSEVHFGAKLISFSAKYKTPDFGKERRLRKKYVFHPIQITQQLNNRLNFYDCSPKSIGEAINLIVDGKEGIIDTKRCSPSQTNESGEYFIMLKTRDQLPEAVERSGGIRMYYHKGCHHLRRVYPVS